MRSGLIIPASVAAMGMALAPAAHADQDTDGSGGVGSGNQINVPADVEAELCGNALAALGISQAECTEIAETLYAASDEGSEGQSSDGSGGVASGNQINIPVSAALDVCGNAVAVGGVSQAKCEDVVTALEESEENEGSEGQSSDGSGGVASGNQINVPVDVAVNMCGNAVSVLGVAQGECSDVVIALEESEENEESQGQSSDGSGGVASGNQVNVPVDVAADICGNAVSVLGIAEAECTSTISEDDNGEGDNGEGDNGEGDNGEGDNGEGDNGEGDNGKDDEDDNGKGDNGKDDEDDNGKDDEDTEPEADEATPPDQADGGDTLPVTGAALGGLVAAAVAALGLGGLVRYLMRRSGTAAEPTA
ncbi:chaplin family protein [Lipingzhangella sp. LS1_29]|uniref:Chaplin family protein n=1 Tax=Lipingzhangella rawalii TaxID=2055835 RepID=A0ABU2H414_9ACTN|nr:chaplin family protein [Lipingzhangella rawalii]MDS1270041.1 chaplin family protein [Lipingzhangella rawalii]